MTKRHRRDFLKLCASSVPGWALAGHGLGPALSPASPHRTPRTIEPFLDALPLLGRLKPARHTEQGIEYRVRMLEFERVLHSQLPPTRLWGYEGQYPGPVLEAERDRPVTIVWENRLPRKHLFPVDRKIHGAMDTPEVRTVPHLHGSKTRSLSDGLPEKWYTPGKAGHYFYSNEQPAATLWYHDHAVGITRLNVYAGLSGFYLLRDNEERAMKLPDGEFEIPMLLQDRTLDEAGQLVYAPTFDDGERPAPGGWGSEFFGDLALVNGAIYPYLEVEPRPYRLRMLNSCNSRFLNLSFNLAKKVTDPPDVMTFHQIGSDGGLLPKPAAMNRVLMAPAERVDLIVDFSGHAGKTALLENRAPAPYPGWDVLMSNRTVMRPPLNEFMQFRVTRPLSAAKSFSLPAGAASFKRLDPAAAVRSRDFVLSEKMDDKGHSTGMLINGVGYDAPVTERVKLDSVERWRFINTTEDAHPMHVHLVQFQILERQGYDPGQMQAGRLVMVGAPRVPQAGEAGWKDTAVVNPRDTLTVLAKFEGYKGRYVFHCHMLEHEDNDMMRPFEVV